MWIAIGSEFTVWTITLLISVYVIKQGLIQP